MANEAHVRIDEGVKRGPRKRKEATTRSPKADLGSWVIPPELSPDAVLERYMSESTTSQIAAEYGLSRKALVRWLRETRPEQWKQTQVIRALCRKEDADEGLESACDALSLACAREQLKSGQWDLERLDSKNYGQKQEVTVREELKLEVVLDGEACALLAKIRPKTVVIDAQCSAQEASLPFIPDDSQSK